MSARQIIYLTLAAVNFCTIAYYNLLFSLDYATPVWLALGHFFADSTQTNASLSIMYDVMGGFVCFVVFAFFEGRRIGMRNVWIYAALLPTLHSFAFAFPVFLYFRERRFRAVHSETRASLADA